MFGFIDIVHGVNVDAEPASEERFQVLYVTAQQLRRVAVADGDNLRHVNQKEQACLLMCKPVELAGVAVNKTVCSKRSEGIHRLAVH